MGRRGFNHESRFRVSDLECNNALLEKRKLNRRTRLVIVFALFLIVMAGFGYSMYLAFAPQSCGAPELPTEIYAPGISQQEKQTIFSAFVNNRHYKLASHHKSDYSTIRETKKLIKSIYPSHCRDHEAASSYPECIEYRRLKALESCLHIERYELENAYMKTIENTIKGSRADCMSYDPVNDACPMTTNTNQNKSKSSGTTGASDQKLESDGRDANENPDKNVITPKSNKKMNRKVADTDDSEKKIGMNAENLKNFSTDDEAKESKANLKPEVTKEANPAEETKTKVPAADPLTAAAAAAANVEDADTTPKETTSKVPEESKPNAGAFEPEAEPAKETQSEVPAADLGAAAALAAANLEDADTTLKGEPSKVPEESKLNAGAFEPEAKPSEGATSNRFLGHKSTTDQNRARIAGVSPSFSSSRFTNYRDVEDDFMEPRVKN